MLRRLYAALSPFRRSLPLQQERKLVSLGGWCGPALILGKLGLRTEAYPFDFSRVTLDGILHFVRNGFGDGFFPPGSRPFRPECVGMWVLFRGRHTAFAHFDLNDPKITAAFERKFERWVELLDGRYGPVTFLRTVSAADPAEELAVLPHLEALLAAKHPALDFRIVVTVHDQPMPTAARARAAPTHPEAAASATPGGGGLAALSSASSSASVAICPWRGQHAALGGCLSRRIAVYVLEYTEDASKTLFDRSQSGYTEIVRHATQEMTWEGEAEAEDKSDESSSSSRGAVDAMNATSSTGSIDSGAAGHRPYGMEGYPWRLHRNIALIDGVASVGGTCTGIGSSQCAADGTCHFCGKLAWHLAGTPFRSDRPFTDEEDSVLLVHLYSILAHGADKVAAVEQLAHEMHRGAYEVICRLQFITNNSTKITEGIGPAGEEGPP